MTNLEQQRIEQLEVKIADLQTNDESNPQQGNPTPSSSITKKHVKIPPTKRDSRKLFVGGLPTNLTNDEFRDFFQTFGTIIDSVVMIDRDTRRSRGFGFVTFEKKDVAQGLLGNSNKSNMINIGGKLCEVKAAEPKQGGKVDPKLTNNDTIKVTNKAGKDDTTVKLNSNPVPPPKSNKEHQRQDIPKLGKGQNEQFTNNYSYPDYNHGMRYHEAVFHTTPQNEMYYHPPPSIQEPPMPSCMTATAAPTTYIPYTPYQYSMPIPPHTQEFMNETMPPPPIIPACYSYPPMMPAPMQSPSYAAVNPDGMPYPVPPAQQEQMLYHHYLPPNGMFYPTMYPMLHAMTTPPAIISSEKFPSDQKDEKNGEDDTSAISTIAKHNCTAADECV